MAIRPAAGHNFIALFVRHFLCAHVKAQVSVRYTKSVYLRGINQRPQPSGRAVSETAIKMSEMHMPKREMC